MTALSQPCPAPDQPQPHPNLRPVISSSDPLYIPQPEPSSDLPFQPLLAQLPPPEPHLTTSQTIIIPFAPPLRPITTSSICNLSGPGRVQLPRSLVPPTSISFQAQTSGRVGVSKPPALRRPLRKTRDAQPGEKRRLGSLPLDTGASSMAGTKRIKRTGSRQEETESESEKGVGGCPITVTRTQ